MDAKGAADDKKADDEKTLTLGEIAKVNDFITNTKVEGLQPLHTVSLDNGCYNNVLQ